MHKHRGVCLYVPFLLWKSQKRKKCKKFHSRREIQSFLQKCMLGLESYSVADTIILLAQGKLVMFTWQGTWKDQVCAFYFLDPGLGTVCCIYSCRKRQMHVDFIDFPHWRDATKFWFPIKCNLNFFPLDMWSEHLEAVYPLLFLSPWMSDWSVQLPLTWSMHMIFQYQVFFTSPT